VAALSAVFFVVLLVSRKLGMLTSINGIRRKSQGSILYPVIVLLVFAFYLWSAGAAHPQFNKHFYFALPTLIMAICDPAAALAGSLYRRRHPSILPGKTMAGSLTFFLVALALSTGTVLLFAAPATSSATMLLLVFLETIITTLCERFSTGGWDNFTIPVGAAGCIYLMEYLGPLV
jgi:dolichol kinase